MPIRNIASLVGTLYCGLTSPPSTVSNQTSAAVWIGTSTSYDGIAFYIMVGNIVGGGNTVTVAIQVTNDSSGTPVANNWTAVSNSDLSVWQASASGAGQTAVSLGAVAPPTLTSAAPYSLRIAWCPQSLTFTANNSPGDGLSHTASWIRLVTTFGGVWGSGPPTYDAVIILGAPPATLATPLI